MRNTTTNFDDFAPDYRKIHTENICKIGGTDSSYFGEYKVKIISANENNNKKVSILDLGCGSGRDSRAFLAQGYRVTAIDGSIELCKIASEQLGHPVRCQRFEELDDEAIYDGVWACASLLHLPTPVLKDTIYRVERALKPGGYFYASFKYGTYEGERDGRYFNDFTEEKWRDVLHDFPSLTLQELEVTIDVIPGREEIRWLNVIMKKASKLGGR